MVPLQKQRHRWLQGARTEKWDAELNEEKGVAPRQVRRMDDGMRGGSGQNSKNFASSDYTQQLGRGEKKKGKRMVATKSWWYGNSESAFGGVENKKRSGIAATQGH